MSSSRRDVDAEPDAAPLVDTAAEVTEGRSDPAGSPAVTGPATAPSVLPDAAGRPEDAAEDEVNDEPTDLDLLRAHAAGDRRAFGTLVARHQDRMWAVALGTLRNRDDAADAVQDALLSAWRAAGSFRGDSAVATWLHRIVVNACLDLLRRRKVRPAVPLPEAGPDEPADPHDAIADRDTVLTVREGLAALSEEHRAVLTLVDLLGHSVAEAADILGVAEGTIKSRCARGRLALARVLRRVPESVDPRDVKGEARGGGGPAAPADKRDDQAGAT